MEQSNTLAETRWEEGKMSEVTYDALKNRIAQLEAAVEDMAKHVWRGDWDKLKPETRAILEPKK